MKQDLTQGRVHYLIVKMTLPMIGGMFAMSAFNLTDTYFVSRLGTDALAAMSFTFPVVMIVFSCAMGLALGASSTISRAIGMANKDQVKRLTTDCLLLSITIISLVSITGLLTMDIQFHLLGAPAKLIPMIKEYMTIWYCFIPLTILPMVGNNTIRATGNTLIPGIIMISASIINIILDPILIFGLCGFPQMGIQGAAIATVTSRLLSLIISFYILHFKYHQLASPFTKLQNILQSWKKILHIALPSMGTYLLLPISMAFITRIISTYGEAAVAGAGAGSKIQHFAYMIPMALGTAIVPFIGQNHGAKRYDRIIAGWTFTNWFSIFYGLFCVFLALPLAPQVSRFFSHDPAVTSVINYFIWIIFIGSGFQHITVHTGFMLNAMGYPLHAALLTCFRILLLMIPLSLLGSILFGLNGLFSGLALAQVISGVIALFWMKKVLNKQRLGCI